MSEPKVTIEEAVDLHERVDVLSPLFPGHSIDGVMLTVYGTVS